jgi:flavin-dependent dehydrogenase
VLQPIRAFQLAVLPGQPQRVEFDGIVSYGVLRREFDAFAASRCPAAIHQGIHVNRLRRDGDWWVAEEQFRARVLVGAGGHFCPVARLEGIRPSSGTPVVAECAEFRLRDPGACPVERECPELYFCPDGLGYGWCLRKDDWLNVGMGRAETSGIRSQIDAFLAYLAQKRGVRLESRLLGHAYRLQTHHRDAFARGVVLIGDSAGVARPVSGEGIAPAIDSGIAAAEAILRGEAPLRTRESATAGRVPPIVIRAAVSLLLRRSGQCRHLFLDHYFLHAA